MRALQDAYHQDVEMNVYLYQLDTPTGKLDLIADQQHLLAILWEIDQAKRVPLPERERVFEHELLLNAAQQLQQYFAGNRQQFDLPMRFQGTEFQQQVWQALNTIPFGQTRSYQQIATQINRPKAVRAVGSAIGRNPMSIMVPCHRVIGSSGKLTGFAGGLDNKRLLLDLEQQVLLASDT